MLSLSAPKGSKCPCGKRAKSTLMSSDGLRPLSPCCTKCGLIFMTFKQMVEADEMTRLVKVTPELQKWFATDAGTSSMTIASVLVPALREACLARNHHSGPSVPWDPDDFGRCYRLLKLIPNGVERMPEVAAAHPRWAKLVAAWPELTALFEEEAPSGRAPKLYARMKELTVREGGRHG